MTQQERSSVPVHIGIVPLLFLCITSLAHASAHESAAREKSLSELVRDACAIVEITSEDLGSLKTSITKKYHAKALHMHPDRYNGPKEVADILFKNLNGAHALLVKHISLIPKVLPRKVLPRKPKQARSASSCADDVFEVKPKSTSEPFDFDDFFDACSRNEADESDGFDEFVFEEEEEHVQPKQPMKRFTQEFITQTIFWVENEHNEFPAFDHHPDTGVFGAVKPTVDMRRCYAWLRLQRCTENFRWITVDELLKADADLVNLCGPEGTVLDVINRTVARWSGLISPDIMESAQKTRETLLAYGAVAHFTE